MKRARTKFAKQPLMFQEGGFLGKKGPEGLTGGIGMGLDVIGGLTSAFGDKKAKPLTEGNPYAEGARNAYNDVLAKSQKTKKMVSGTLNGLGDAAIMSGVGAPIGFALKGVAAINNLIPYASKKKNAAMNNFNAMNQAGDQLDMARQGAMNYNSNNAGYRAPAYGKKGLKFKTKFSRA